MKRTWQDPDALRALLLELVAMDSVSGTPGERAFAGLLRDVLLRSEAVRTIADEIVLGDVGQGRSFLRALHRSDATDATILLLSHFDTVDVAEYGDDASAAFDVDALGTALAQPQAGLDADAAADLASGEWLFGRGVMDMKAGLALHVQLLERAVAEDWPINLVLLTVPDEEVNSDGMRAAVQHLVELQLQQGFDWTLFLCGEPSFPAHPGDQRHHVYSGSIGKLLPAVLCCGRETHAGTPLAGITSTVIASELTRRMEWNEALAEEDRGERAPLPVTLEQRDLRAGYSTQTSSRTLALYNAFTMHRSAEEVLQLVEGIAREAAASCSEAWRAACDRAGVDTPGPVRVLRYEQLVAHATGQLGAERVRELVDAALATSGDLRARSVAAADALVLACPDLAPAIVLLFAPPWYPAVCSSGDALVEACIERVRSRASEWFCSDVHRTHWFNGISDLSYLAPVADTELQRSAWRANTPGVGVTYDVPLEAMRQLDAPVLNVGPLGKDPHQRSERLHAPSSFEHLPALLADLVRFVAAGA